MLAKALRKRFSPTLRLMCVMPIALIFTGFLTLDVSGASATAVGVPTKTAGVLLVGSDIPYVPFEFGNPPNYTGFDIDLVRALGKQLDLRVQIQKNPFDTIFRDLAQGRFDMVASSVDITPQRAKVVAFSLPYFNADQSLMVKRGSSVKSV